MASIRKCWPWTNNSSEKFHHFRDDANREDGTVKLIDVQINYQTFDKIFLRFSAFSLKKSSYEVVVNIKT